MKRVFRIGLGLGAVLAGAVLGLYFCLPFLNDFQTRGELTLSGLKKKVVVTRDTRGMAYIRAKNMEDLFFAQGFVTAQDRLFQMQLTRLFLEGRICELAGEKARGLDLIMRTLGLYRMAEKQTQILNPETRDYFQRYVDGINAFIRTCPRDLHLEFKLAGITPDRWEAKDAMGVLYYMGYSTSANLKTEIIAQMLVDTLGYDRTALLLPLNLNIDDPGDRGEIPMPPLKEIATQGPDLRGLLSHTRARRLRVGSNNWALAPAKSATGTALLAGDPHLDTRMLPGVFYPLGLICPGIRAVGVQIPGMPGMAIGRTDHIALSATNNYGDMVDLYVETIDPDNPDHYLEGDASIPFIHIRENLKIRDRDAPGGFRNEPLDIRATRRGPVVSGVMAGLDGQKIITLRFAPAESMVPDLPLLDLLRVKNGQDLAESLKRLYPVCFNWVFADTQGNIGHQASGRIPIRANGNGTFPFKVTGQGDNWQGWIPRDLMPGAMNPKKNWIGTCNQKIVDAGFPFYYSSHFAPSFRYGRLKELMAGEAPLTPVHMWQFQRDVKNPMAEKIAPVMAGILMKDPAFGDMGKILLEWDFMDDPDQAAPGIFQTIYRYFSLAVFEDDLGRDKAMDLLGVWYFWQERLLRSVLKGESPFFDDIRTPEKKETMADLFIRAAGRARKELSASLGDDPGQWHWGRVHSLELVNPIRRRGAGKTLLGTGPMPMGGSGETLFRGSYDFGAPYGVTHCAALRLVVDLGDDDKIMAVLPGGVTGRTFIPHQKDQVKDFMEGKIRYWGFSDQAIERDAASVLVLKP